MKKLFILAIAAITMATAANAQFKLGVTAGFDMANMTQKFDGEKADDNKMKPSFNIGLIGDYSLSESFSISPSLLFATRGYKFDTETFDMDTFESKTETATVNLNYLQLPINAVYRINVGDEMNVLISAGPYIGYALSGKVKVDGDSEDIEIGSDEETDTFKPLDFGLNFGAGMEFGAFQAKLNYGLGLTNLVPGGDSDNSAKNSVFGLSLAYFFMR